MGIAFSHSYWIMKFSHWVMNLQPHIIQPVACLGESHHFNSYFCTAHLVQSSEGQSLLDSASNLGTNWYVQKSESSTPTKGLVLHFTLAQTQEYKITKFATHLVQNGNCIFTFPLDHEIFSLDYQSSFLHNSTRFIS